MRKKCYFVRAGLLVAVVSQSRSNVRGRARPAQDSPARTVAAYEPPSTILHCNPPTIPTMLSQLWRWLLIGWVTGLLFIGIICLSPNAVCGIWMHARRLACTATYRCWLSRGVQCACSDMCHGAIRRSHCQQQSDCRASFTCATMRCVALRRTAVPSSRLRMWLLASQ